MEGADRGVGEKGAGMGGRAPETRALRTLRRAGHDPGHVRRPLHDGLPLEPAENQRAHPSANLLQVGNQGGDGHDG
mgnify:CR=1 FL=1